jgi:hypothetical protein
MKIDDWVRKVSIGFIRLPPPTQYLRCVCDDIMVLNARNAWKPLCSRLPAKKMVSANSQATSCAIRNNGRTTKHGGDKCQPQGRYTRDAIPELFSTLAGCGALLTCGRTRTTRRPGSIRRVPLIRSAVPAPTDRARPGGLRMGSRRSDVALALAVALPWCLDLLRCAPVRRCVIRGNA